MGTIWNRFVSWMCVFNGGKEPRTPRTLLNRPQWTQHKTLSEAKLRYHQKEKGVNRAQAIQNMENEGRNAAQKTNAGKPKPEAEAENPDQS